MSSKKKTARKARQVQQGAHGQKNRTGLLLVLFGLVVLAVVAGVLLNQNRGAAAGTVPAEISVAQAADKQEAGAFILDVREPNEWADFHIPGATLIPLGQLESRLAELPQDQEIVVVCRSGNRSATGRDVLKNAGFENVTSMAGGMNEWRSAGYPVVTGP